MAKTYFKPDDLSTAEARKVLDFLNRAASAREIAETIEIPGELDVGLRVGQRILERRTALGGRFRRPAAGARCAPGGAGALHGNRDGPHRPPAAATPLDTLAGLQNMAAAYGLGRNSELRGAVDIYFQTWRERVSDTVNTRALLNHWSFHDALVTALVHPDDDAAMVTAAAACRVRLKDWVGPWFQAFAGLTSQKNVLDGEFERIRNGETDKDALLERLLSSVHSYVAGQRGRAGEAVGQKAAERTIRHFMATRLPQLPLDTQLTLMPTLDIAHRNIGAAGMGTLATVSRATTNLKKTVDSRVGQIGISGALAERLAGLESRLGSSESDYGTFRRDYEQFTAEMARFRTDFGTFNARFTDFSTRYATFNSNYTIFSRDYQTFSSTYTRFSQEYTAFNRDYGAFGRNFADFNQNHGRFSENYTVFARDFTRFAQDFADFSSRYKDFGRSYAEFRTASGATLAALETFRADYDKFAADFQTFAGAYQAFRTDYGKFATDLQRVNTDLRTFTSTYRGFETNFRKFSTDYKNFQTDYERFRTTPRG